MLIEIADPLGILLVRFLPFDGLGVFGVGKTYGKAAFFQNVEYRNPIFTGRFHTDF